jgi:plastocyanin
MTTIRRLLATAAVAVAVAVAVAACSGGAAASITPPPDADASVTAQNTSFVEQTIELPVDRPTRLFFRNLDGQPHNIAIYADSTASRSLFVGGNVTNAAETYAVPALGVGDYFFRCDVHPSMTGTVQVGG